jgi:CDP-diacylglycerol--glycerol-3-phosphate 3-phosphatidyltransferase
MAKIENIWNIPNFLTLLRIISALVAVYLIFSGYHIYYIAVAFVLGMVTDFFDGQIARRFNMKTEFGRQFDMIADRILIVGVALAIVIRFEITGILSPTHFYQILFMLSREIITTPIAIITMALGAGFPQVRFIGKATTFLQSVTFPLIILSIFYPIFNFSWYFAVLTGALGLISGVYYLIDMTKLTIRRLREIKTAKAQIINQ